jgi:integrase/recombinase XerD
MLCVAETKSNLIQSQDYQIFIDSFINSQDIKENSKQTYRRALKQFFLWVRSNSIQPNSREVILAYKSFLVNQELSSLTVSNYIAALRKFFEWLESMRICPNIAKGIKGTKQSRSFKKDCLTVSQVKELLNNIDRSTVQGKRDFAILNLMIRTGLRTIEIIRADIADIRQHSGEAILWIQGKGRDNKDEFVLLTPETLKPINEYLYSRGNVQDKEPLFTSLSDRNSNQRLTTRSISRIVKQHLRGIGLDNDRLTAHSLRHTAVTLSLLSGASIQEAQQLARHANINTTMVYSHNIDRIANAAEYKIDRLLA